MVKDQDVPQDTSEATMSPAQDQFAQPARIKKDYAGYLVLITGIGANTCASSEIWRSAAKKAGQVSHCGPLGGIIRVATRKYFNVNL